MVLDPRYVDILKSVLWFSHLSPLQVVSSTSKDLVPMLIIYHNRSEFMFNTQQTSTKLAMNRMFNELSGLSILLCVSSEG